MSHIEDRAELNPIKIDLGEMKDLFGHNSLPGTPVDGESSPYGETALLRTNIDLG